VLGAIYARLGRKEESIKLLKELQTPPITYDKQYATSSILVNSGHPNEALAILNKLVKIKYGLLVYFNVERSFYGEQAEKTLEPIRKRMGFKD